jgi:hypothetical protein
MVDTVQRLAGIHGRRGVELCIVACLGYGPRALVLSVADNGNGLPQRPLGPDRHARARRAHLGAPGVRRPAQRRVVTGTGAPARRKA